MAIRANANSQAQNHCAIPSGGLCNHGIIHAICDHKIEVEATRYIVICSTRGTLDDTIISKVIDSARSFDESILASLERPKLIKHSRTPDSAFLVAQFWSVAAMVEGDWFPYSPMKYAIRPATWGTAID